MSAASAPSRSAGSCTGPVVAAIASSVDLPLVLVAAAQAERRGATLVLVNARMPGYNWSFVPGTIRGLTPRYVASGGDHGLALRDRALSLAQLCGVEVTWLSSVGHPNAVVARYCRDNRAALLVVGASRRQLVTRRRHRMLAAARRLRRRAHTPIHIVTT